MRAYDLFPNTITPLMEAEVPPTRYGYWLTDAGEIIPVHFHGHEDIANQHNFRSGYEAVQAGWIRIISQPGRGSFNVEIAPYRASPRAFSSLRRVISSGDYWEFHLDIVDAGSKSFNKSGGLINMVQQNLKRMS